MNAEHERLSTPDPTLLTTQQLLRELFSLRELLEAQIRGIDAKLETRLSGMDKAIGLIQSAADRVPSEVDLKVGNLQALVFERFEGISTQFVERDTRTAETASLNKLAIDAALQAQKEAAGKSEEGFTKQIEKQGDLIETKTVALGSELRANLQAQDGRIKAAESRLDRIESAGIGAGNATSDARSERHIDNSFLLALAAAALVAFGLILKLSGG